MTRIDSSVPVADLVHRKDVVDLMAKEARDHTADLAKFEQVRKIAVLPRELTVDAGDLSPTLKVRRRVVEQKYADEIEHLYAGEDARSEAHA